MGGGAYPGSSGAGSVLGTEGRKIPPSFQENILTNESLKKLFKNHPNAPQVLQEAGYLSNGYEMSVQKLAKVSSIEQDSIYSTMPN